MLNKVQTQVAFEVTGNTIVSASPGTGKTKTLVARAQRKLESMPKHKWLALITYTNAAADEISSRLHEDGKHIFLGTIHRFCLEFILRPFSWIYNWGRPKLLSYQDRLEFISLNPDIDLGDSPLDELNKIKRNLNGETDDSMEWTSPSNINVVAIRYFKFLSDKKLIDFNEILYRSYKVISENNFVAISLSSKFHEILVDEFQDTNIYQYEIFKKIHASKKCTFFFVGDEKQKIYTFAGAINDAFTKASIDFEAGIYVLDTTYRSVDNVIKSYKTLFKEHPDLINESKYKDSNEPIVIKEISNAHNSFYIEQMLESLLTKSNISLSKIAILTTSWREAFNVSRHLRQKFQLVGFGALPHRNTNNAIFALLRSLSMFILNPTTRSLRIVRRNVELFILEHNIELAEKEFTILTNTLIGQFRKLDLKQDLISGYAMIKTVFAFHFGNIDVGIDELISLIADDEGRSWTLQKYFKTLSGSDGITVNTIHQSKGLEYEVVFLNGINENRLPFQRFIARQGNQYLYEPLTEDNIENGRTLLYVGISRCKLKLFVTHNWRPSMFVSYIRSSM